MMPKMIMKNTAAIKANSAIVEPRSFLVVILRCMFVAILVCIPP